MVVRKIKSFLRNYFGYSKNETQFILIMVPLLLVVPFCYHNIVLKLRDHPPTKAIIPSAQLNHLKQESSTTHLSKPDSVKFNNIRHHANTQTSKTLLFSFNPNLLPQDSLRLIFNSNYIVSNIVKYRESGGNFYRASDFRKIYGLNDSIYNSLLPYLNFEQRPSLGKKKLNSIQLELTPFDINLADTIQLKRLSGIGSILSKRIIKFRDKLGGFVNLDQLYEIYRLDSETVNIHKNILYIDPSFEPKKISIYRTDINGLVKHPYIGKKEAKMIKSYLVHRPNAHNIDTLLSIPGIDSLKFNKFKPYLSLE